MEHNEQDTRQYSQTHFFGRTQNQVPAHLASSTATDRFRQLQYSQAPSIDGLQGLRPLSDQGSAYPGAGAYTSSPIHANALGYATSYGSDTHSHETVPSSQHQLSQQYATTLGYASMPQTATSSQGSTYQYHRGSASTDASSSQFAVTPTHYYGGQHVPSQTPDSATEMASAYPNFRSMQAALPSYPNTNDMLQTQTSSYDVYSQQSHTQSDYGAGQPVDSDFAAYQSRIRTIFTRVRDGQLASVGELLLQCSQYLLGNAEALGTWPSHLLPLLIMLRFLDSLPMSSKISPLNLNHRHAPPNHLPPQALMTATTPPSSTFKNLTTPGLDKDTPSLSADRLAIWDEFNRAWLTTLSRQHTLTLEMLKTSQAPPEPQSLMTSMMMEALGRDLVHLCDSVERFGLVDYQMGCAEEEIVGCEFVIFFFPRLSLCHFVALPTFSHLMYSTEPKLRETWQLAVVNGGFVKGIL